MFINEKLEHKSPNHTTHLPCTAERTPAIASLSSILKQLASDLTSWFLGFEALIQLELSGAIPEGVSRSM